MPCKIVIVEGHPDTDDARFGHVLAEAYAAGALEAGHEVRRIRVGALDVPVVRSRAEWEHPTAPGALAQSQEALAWADHMVLLYPLWLGTMPALLKAWLEQVFRPGFAVEGQTGGTNWHRRLKGKSARIVVTMGMPALAYRWFFRAHSLKSLERNILKFSGIRPIRESLVGMVEAKSGAGRARWLAAMRRLGAQGK
jgi:putative NADPH-quinone reductase